MANIGIVSIVNKANGKEFIIKSKNLVKKIENTRNLLNFNCHFNHELQSDWNEFGPSNFNYIIISSNLKNESELNKQYLDYLKTVNYVYNAAVSDLIKPLNCDIEILSAKFYDLVGKDFNTKLFDQKLLENNLSSQDGINFKIRFIEDINKGLINYYNFDDEFNKFFKKIYDDKLINSLESTLDVIDFDSKLIKYDLNDEDKSKIVSLLKAEIQKGKITTIDEISKNTDTLIEQEYLNKLNKSSAYDKLYDLTGKNGLKREFKYYLKSRDMPLEVGYNIQNMLKELIEKGEVTPLNIEDVYNILLENQFNKFKENDYNKKQSLVDKLDQMSFEDALEKHDLHENAKYVLKEKIISQILNEKIKSVDDIEFKSYRLIKDFEIEDVRNRLHDLKNNQIDIILTKNNIRTGRFTRKASKINIIINNVPINIIKNHIKSITGDLEPVFIANPNVKYCTECGSLCDKDDLFCDQCGHNF